MSINYCCSIKTQIVMSTVISAFVQWTYYNFPNTFNWYLTTQMSTNKKKCNKKWQTFFLQIFRKYHIFLLLILLRKAILVWKTRRSCYTLVRPFPTLSCFPFFSQTYLDLIFATKIKTILLKQSAVFFTSCQTNIEYIICLNT